MPKPNLRLPTGSADLDRILGGGVPRGSTIVLAGPPGSGKTLLAQQMAFVNAQEDAPALYYTSWSEPHTKLIRNLAGFDFFDEEAIGKRVEFLHLPALVEEAAESGLDNIARELFQASVKRQPALVVIDSSKSLHGLVPEDRYVDAARRPHHVQSRTPPSLDGRNGPRLTDAHVNSRRVELLQRFRSYKNRGQWLMDSTLLRQRRDTGELDPRSSSVDSSPQVGARSYSRRASRLPCCSSSSNVGTFGSARRSTSLVPR